MRRARGSIAGLAELPAAAGGAGAGATRTKENRRTQKDNGK